jgi:hypothetical protein
VPAGGDRDALRAQVDEDLRVGGQELGRDANDPGGRGRNLHVLQEDRRYQFIDQDAAVLGVVAELDDIEVAVVGFQEVGLSPAAHFADMPAGGERHRNAVP